MLPGAMQVPPSGDPVIFLADGPTTGGYPVVGVIPAAALPLLAQLRPGSTLRFLPSRLDPGDPAPPEDDWY
jgi:allophanate hydrolase subunit 2